MTEEKVKFLMRIDPDTDRKIKAAMPRANCRSQNEFMESAVRFYCDYLAAEDVAEFLPPIFVHAMRGTIQCSEDRPPAVQAHRGDRHDDARAGGGTGDRQQPTGSAAMAVRPGGEENQRRDFVQRHVEAA